MYIKNKRDSSSIKACSPFELSYKLKDLRFEIAYFSYTQRQGQGKKDKPTSKIKEKNKWH